MPCSLLRVLIGLRNFKTDEKKKNGLLEEII